MSLADDLKPLIRTIRAIPGELGLRPFTVDIIIGTWTGEYVGRGNEDVETTRITEANGQSPKVRSPNDEEIALGSVGKGDYIVGPITPSNGTVGTALTDLLPALSNGQTKHAILTGPGHENGTVMRVKEVRTDRALRYMLTLTPVSAVLE